MSLYVTRSPGSSSSLGSLHDAVVPVAAPPPAARARSGSGSSSVGSPVGSDPEKPAVVEHHHVAAVLDPEKAAADVHHHHHHGKDHDGSTADDAGSDTSRSPLHHAVSSGRPDAASLVTDAVRTTPAGQRVLVAACGPPGLMRTVRDATARCISGDGPGVELHCEQFGW